ncbi:unnamed protein product [Vitrella brassicaformis CCMP3155]|uniref:Uncharacterized protein n=6 Tax=Vitrella brassicaformis TaxID=1169539 RepID=A0A0G4F5D3_VITBC|nr:unnamed protein product [Vitrella brassicaformis CCMP3155]|eukprot:CEM06938.1 unnamed protein product [Vitrella brassicaformis CCMP3155]
MSQPGPLRNDHHKTEAMLKLEYGKNLAGGGDVAKVDVHNPNPRIRTVEDRSKAEDEGQIANLKFGLYVKTWNDLHGAEATADKQPKEVEIAAYVDVRASDIQDYWWVAPVVSFEISCRGTDGTWSKNATLSGSWSFFKGSLSRGWSPLLKASSIIKEGVLNMEDKTIMIKCTARPLFQTLWTPDPRYRPYLAWAVHPNIFAATDPVDGSGNQTTTTPCTDVQLPDDHPYIVPALRVPFDCTFATAFLHILFHLKPITLHLLAWRAQKSRGAQCGAPGGGSSLSPSPPSGNTRRREWTAASATTAAPSAAAHQTTATSSSSGGGPSLPRDEDRITMMSTLQSFFAELYLQVWVQSLQGIGPEEAWRDERDRSCGRAAAGSGAGLVRLEGFERSINQQTAGQMGLKDLEGQMGMAQPKMPAPTALLYALAADQPERAVQDIIENFNPAEEIIAERGSDSGGGKAKSWCKVTTDLLTRLSGSLKQDKQGSRDSSAQVMAIFKYLFSTSYNDKGGLDDFAKVPIRLSHPSRDRTPDKGTGGQAPAPKITRIPDWIEDSDRKLDRLAPVMLLFPTYKDLTKGDEGLHEIPLAADLSGLLRKKDNSDSSGDKEKERPAESESAAAAAAGGAVAGDRPPDTRTLRRWEETCRLKEARRAAADTDGGGEANGIEETPTVSSVGVSCPSRPDDPKWEPQPHQQPQPQPQQQAAAASTPASATSTPAKKPPGGGGGSGGKGKQSKGRNRPAEPPPTEHKDDPPDSPPPQAADAASSAAKHDAEASTDSNGTADGVDKGGGGGSGAAAGCKPTHDLFAMIVQETPRIPTKKVDGAERGKIETHISVVIRPVQNGPWFRVLDGGVEELRVVKDRVFPSEWKMNEHFYCAVAVLFQHHMRLLTGCSALPQLYPTISRCLYPAPPPASATQLTLRASPPPLLPGLSTHGMLLEQSLPRDLRGLSMYQWLTPIPFAPPLDAWQDIFAFCITSLFMAGSRAGGSAGAVLEKRRDFFEECLMEYAQRLIIGYVGAFCERFWIDRIHLNEIIADMVQTILSLRQELLSLSANGTRMVTPPPPAPSPSAAASPSPQQPPDDAPSPSASSQSGGSKKDKKHKARPFKQGMEAVQCRISWLTEGAGAGAGAGASPSPSPDGVALRGRRVAREWGEVRNEVRVVARRFIMTILAELRCTYDISTNDDGAIAEMQRCRDSNESVHPWVDFQRQTFQFDSCILGALDRFLKWASRLSEGIVTWGDVAGAACSQDWFFHLTRDIWQPATACRDPETGVISKQYFPLSAQAFCRYAYSIPSFEKSALQLNPSRIYLFADNTGKPVHQLPPRGQWMEIMLLCASDMIGLEEWDFDAKCTSTRRIIANMLMTVEDLYHLLFFVLFLPADAYLKWSDPSSSPEWPCTEGIWLYAFTDLKTDAAAKDRKREQQRGFTLMPIVPESQRHRPLRDYVDVPSSGDPQNLIMQSSSDRDSGPHTLKILVLLPPRPHGIPETSAFNNTTVPRYLRHGMDGGVHALAFVYQGYPNRTNQCIGCMLVPGAITLGDLFNKCILPRLVASKLVPPKMRSPDEPQEVKDVVRDFAHLERKECLRLKFSWRVRAKEKPSGVSHPRKTLSKWLDKEAANKLVTIFVQIQEGKGQFIPPLPTIQPVEQMGAAAPNPFDDVDDGIAWESAIDGVEPPPPSPPAATQPDSKSNRQKASTNSKADKGKGGDGSPGASKREGSAGSSRDSDGGGGGKGGNSGGGGGVGEGKASRKSAAPMPGGKFDGQAKKNKERKKEVEKAEVLKKKQDDHEAQQKKEQADKLAQEEADRQREMEAQQQRQKEQQQQQQDADNNNKKDKEKEAQQKKAAKEQQPQPPPEEDTTKKRKSTAADKKPDNKAASKSSESNAPKAPPDAPPKKGRPSAEAKKAALEPPKKAVTGKESSKAKAAPQTPLPITPSNSKDVQTAVGKAKGKAPPAIPPAASAAAAAAAVAHNGTSAAEKQPKKRSEKQQQQQQMPPQPRQPHNFGRSIGHDGPVSPPAPSSSSGQRPPTTPSFDSALASRTPPSDDKSPSHGSRQAAFPIRPSQPFVGDRPLLLEPGGKSGAHAAHLNHEGADDHRLADTRHDRSHAKRHDHAPSPVAAAPQQHQPPIILPTPPSNASAAKGGDKHGGGGGAGPRCRKEWVVKPKAPKGPEGEASESEGDIDDSQPSQPSNSTPRVPTSHGNESCTNPHLEDGPNIALSPPHRSPAASSPIVGGAFALGGGSGEVPSSSSVSASPASLPSSLPCAPLPALDPPSVCDQPDLSSDEPDFARQLQRHPTVKHIPCVQAVVQEVQDHVWADIDRLNQPLGQQQQQQQQQQHPRDQPAGGIGIFVQQPRPQLSFGDFVGQHSPPHNNAAVQMPAGLHQGSPHESPSPPSSESAPSPAVVPVHSPPTCMANSPPPPFLMHIMAHQPCSWNAVPVGAAAAASPMTPLGLSSPPLLPQPCVGMEYHVPSPHHAPSSPERQYRDTMEPHWSRPNGQQLIGDHQHPHQHPQQPPQEQQQQQQQEQQEQQEEGSQGPKPPGLVHINKAERESKRPHEQPKDVVPEGFIGLTMWTKDVKNLDPSNPKLEGLRLLDAHYPSHTHKGVDTRAGKRTSQQHGSTLKEHHHHHGATRSRTPHHSRNGGPEDGGGLFNTNSSEPDLQAPLRSQGKAPYDSRGATFYPSPNVPAGGGPHGPSQAAIVYDGQASTAVPFTPEPANTAVAFTPEPSTGSPQWNYSASPQPQGGGMGGLPHATEAVAGGHWQQQQITDVSAIEELSPPMRQQHPTPHQPFQPPPPPEPQPHAHPHAHVHHRSGLAKQHPPGVAHRPSQPRPVLAPQPQGPHLPLPTPKAVPAAEDSVAKVVLGSLSAQQPTVVGGNVPSPYAGAPPIHAVYGGGMHQQPQHPGSPNAGAAQQQQMGVLGAVPVGAMGVNERVKGVAGLHGQGYVQQPRQ